MRAAVLEQFGEPLNVTEIDLKDTGHWLMEERPEQTMEALISFL